VALLAVVVLRPALAVAAEAVLAEGPVPVVEVERAAQLRLLPVVDELRAVLRLFQVRRLQPQARLQRVVGAAHKQVAAAVVHQLPAVVVAESEVAVQSLPAIAPGRPFPAWKSSMHCWRRVPIPMWR
jgi:hypothetical protein